MNIPVTSLVLIWSLFAIYCTAKAPGAGRTNVDRVRLYRGPVYKQGSWKTDEAQDTLHGISSYKRRQMYKDNPDKEPTICYNEMELRGEIYGYFICPEEGQEDSHNDCCGANFAQNCCDEASTRTLISVIVGGITATMILLILILVCFTYTRNKFSMRKAPAQSFISQQTMLSNDDTSTTPSSSVETTEYSNIYSTPISSGIPKPTDSQAPQKTTPLGFEGGLATSGNHTLPCKERSQSAI